MNFLAAVLLLLPFNTTDMISVVIPTYNDENIIASTISKLKENAYTRLLKEIIVVDAGSNDRTVSEAEKAGATVVHSVRKNRASQMNLGVQYATGKILYFITPGSVPPKNFTNEIVRATQKGYFMGTFSLGTNYQSWFSSTVNWMASLKTKFARLEDQSFFVLQELLTKAGSFREDYLILEDHELINRLKRYSSFAVLKEAVQPMVSKYSKEGMLRSQASYLIARMMHQMGYSQGKLLDIYNLMVGRKIVREKTPTTLKASFN
jgi:glycosyltransferase involved in cell wall biosynthesis